MFNRKLYMKIWRDKNKLHIHKYFKNYSLLNKEHLKELHRAYGKKYNLTKKRKVWLKKYYQSEKYKTHRSLYNKKDVSKKYFKRYRDNNKKAISVSRRKWYKKFSSSEEGKLLCKMRNHNRWAKTRSMTVELIQTVYESNIKIFGTLTCYLCLKPILFGKDHLEHKTPLSRGGNSNVENLDVSCESCNHSKGNKTVAEYSKWKEKYV